MKSKSIKHLDKHIARLLAVQYLYSKLFSDRENIDNLQFEPNTILDIIEERKYDTDLYVVLVEGAMKFEKEIDETVKKLAPEWPLSEINPVNLLILRIAMVEAFIYKRTPAPIVIDEAIELGKEVNPEGSTSFINGVLGSVIKDDKMQEYLFSLKENDEE
jgi:N utilization substance protein B